MFSSKSLVTLMLFSLALAGCGGKKKMDKSFSETTAIENVFVKGDPKALLAGASTRDFLDFINKSNYQKFDEYSLSHVITYTEKEVIIDEKNVRQETNAEAGNEASTSDTTENGKENIFSFSNTGNLYLYSSPKMKVKLQFSEYAGYFILDKVIVDNEKFDLDAIHYSKADYADAFSILAETKDSENGTILIAFTFTRKTEPKAIEKVSDYFKFLFGPGVKIGWSQDFVLHMNICGQQDARVENAYKDGIRTWNNALRGRLEVETRILTTYPPFSDLNTNCIYTVNSYYTRADKNLINMASAITKADLFQGRFIDGDIMVWVKENEKYGVSLAQVHNLVETTAHEFGHILGLDHQFDKSIRSLMSYEDERTTSFYDEEAIKQLYPMTKLF